MWKSIEDFPLYEVNEFGVVRNAKTHYVTTQRMNRNGYLYVQLKDEEKKPYSISASSCSRSVYP